MPGQFKIEHILPHERKHVALRLDWSNFLLTCDFCNANKRDRQDSSPYTDPVAARARYFWPDRDNTARAFAYPTTNFVDIGVGLTTAEADKARATRHMLGLDKPRSDPRVVMRSEAWKAAGIFAQSYFSHPTAAKCIEVATAAKGYGFWSIWRSTFVNAPEVLLALNREFRGTASCFDAVSAAPVARAGGQL